jgi:hypothetical protein
MRKSLCNLFFEDRNLFRVAEMMLNTKTEMVLTMYCSAANDMATAVSANKKMICSGSLMAVLNRMMERAPTNPKERANEDLMVVMIKYMAKEKNMKLDAKTSLFDATNANFLNKT